MKYMVQRFYDVLLATCNITLSNSVHRRLAMLLDAPYDTVYSHKYRPVTKEWEYRAYEYSDAHNETLLLVSPATEEETKYIEAINSIEKSLNVLDALFEEKKS